MKSAASTIALTPCSGAAPACEARPRMVARTVATPEVARTIISRMATVGSKDSTTSCSRAVASISAAEPADPRSSSVLNSTPMIAKSVKPRAFSSLSVCRMTAMPPLSSAMPGPKARAPSIRNGARASVPRGYTVSMCAISRMRRCPVPARRATRFSPATGPTGLWRVTVAPSALSSPSSKSTMAAMPSVSPVPVSMLTSRSSVFTTAGCSAVAACSRASSRACAQGDASQPAASSHAAALVRHLLMPVSSSL